MQKQAKTRQTWKNVLIAIFDIIAVNAAYLVALNARFLGYTDLSELFQQKLIVWTHFTPIYTVLATEMTAEPVEPMSLTAFRPHSPACPVPFCSF